MGHRLNRLYELSSSHGRAKTIAAFLSLALNIGLGKFCVTNMRNTLPGVVGPDSACVGGEPLGAVLGCLPLAVALDLADLNVPLLGGLPGKGGQGDGGVGGAGNLNVHWKQKSTPQVLSNRQ